MAEDVLLIVLTLILVLVLTVLLTWMGWGARTACSLIRPRCPWRPTGEKIVFSFSLYGNMPKYTRGMVANAREIARRFPGTKVWVYYCADVPKSTVETLRCMRHVRMLLVERKAGCGNFMSRFQAMGDPSVDVMIVRDADSRVYDRDAACITEFLNDSEYILHIVRDHLCHRFVMLGGMWAIRRPALIYAPALLAPVHMESGKHYGMDQDFLRDHVYKPIIGQCPECVLIHDEKHQREYKEVANGATVRSFPYTGAEKKDFVGQSYDYRNDDEFAVYTV